LDRELAPGTKFGCVTQRARFYQNKWTTKPCPSTSSADESSRRCGPAWP
jgi:hypothetical protein